MRKKKKIIETVVIEKEETHVNLLQHLETNEPSDFKNYLRIENHLLRQLLARSYIMLKIEIPSCKNQF